MKQLFRFTEKLCEINESIGEILAKLDELSSSDYQCVILRNAISDLCDAKVFRVHKSRLNDLNLNEQLSKIAYGIIHQSPELQWVGSLNFRNVGEGFDVEVSYSDNSNGVSTIAEYAEVEDAVAAFKILTSFSVLALKPGAIL